MAFTASLSPAAVAVAPGGQAEAELRIRNIGDAVDHYHVEILGVAAAWATPEPEAMALGPGGDAVVRLVFRPPGAGDGTAGPVAYGVRVRSKEDRSASRVEEGLLEVAPAPLVAAALAEATVRGRRRAVARLAVDNRGTRTVRAQVGASGADLDLEVDPPSFEAGAGRSTLVRIGLRPTGALRSGPPRVHPFEVVVSEGGRRLAAVEGRMIQEPAEPPWLRPAAIGALAAFGALLLLWLVALGPAVRSAARDEARQVTRQSSAPPTIGPSTGGGSGAAAGTPADPPADPGTATPAGTPISGRLALTGRGTTSYEVPAGSSLQVTDIVLQNPAGNTGTLQIRRDGTPLLVVELANFRDLDYHFVAPILLTAGQKLELSATCDSPSCTPGAYFAGFLEKT